MFILHLRQNRVLPSMLACSVLLLLAAKPDNIISTRYLSKIGIKKVQGNNLDNTGGPKRWKVGLKSSFHKTLWTPTGSIRIRVKALTKFC